MTRDNNWRIAKLSFGAAVLFLLTFLPSFLFHHSCMPPSSVALIYRYRITGSRGIAFRFECVHSGTNRLHWLHYMHMCVCVCVCARARARASLKLREREKKKEKARHRIFKEVGRPLYSAPTAKKHFSNAVRLRDSNTIWLTVQLSQH
jgi:hypothetical protein